MSEENILKQINLLNPKVKNKEVADIEISEATSSDDINYNAIQFNNNNNNNSNNKNNRVTLNEEDNDVLNLWSQTNFFFDPVDPSKIGNYTEIKFTIFGNFKEIENNITHQKLL